MIKIVENDITYQDDNQKFTVVVKVDRTNHTKEVTSLTGPGISGAVAQVDSSDFLALMNYIFNDTLSV